MVVDSLGRLIFVYLKNVPFHFAIMRPKVLPGYGVLPYQAFMNPALAEQAGMITEIEWRVSGRSPVWSGGCTPGPASTWFVPANARWSFSTSPPEHFIAGGVVTENVPALHEQVGVVPENRAINVIAGSAIVSFSRQWEQRQSEKEKERGSLAGCAPEVLLGVFFALRLPRGEI
jgi:hypothetical protein